MNKLITNYKLLLFYWLVSFVLAVGGYYFLLFVLPFIKSFGSTQVFGAWYRMHCYHFRNPIQYIIIPVFFYGIIATWLSDRFHISSRKTLYTLLIVFLTIIVSSPFGGVLWHYHDMQAGWFPKNWINKLFGGFQDGLLIGWLLMALSIPYNILGILVVYYVTSFGCKYSKQSPNQVNAKRYNE